MSAPIVYFGKREPSHDAAALATHTRIKDRA